MKSYTEAEMDEMDEINADLERRNDIVGRVKYTYKKSLELILFGSTCEYARELAKLALAEGEHYEKSSDQVGQRV